MLSRDGLVDKRVEAGEVEQIKLMPEPRIQSLAEPWLLLDIGRHFVLDITSQTGEFPAILVHHLPSLSQVVEFFLLEFH